MKISVVTVCLNSEATIAATLESFLAQRHLDKELIVIDGMSRDRTADIVRSYNSPLISLVSEADRGIYDAMNKGLGRFRGDAVGFLNSDDTFHDPFALERIAEGLQVGDVVYGDLYLVTDHETKQIVRTWKAGTYHRFAFPLGWVPPHPTFYVRRKIVEAIGDFELKYSIASDYDFMLRAMSLKSAKVQYVPHFLADYKIGGSSSKDLRNIIKGNLECLDSRQRHLRSGPIDLAFFARPARRLGQIKWRNYLRRVWP